MIELSGKPFQQSDQWPAGSMENMIIQSLVKDPILYSYQSMGELEFELTLRKNIILSADAMSKSAVEFETFAGSRSNPQYWHLTRTGGFMVRNDVKPSDAIQDIYRNSSLYAFECATAKVIILYYAILHSIGERLFNQFFQNLYLYSWHFDPDLVVQSIQTKHFIPGDIVYFNNPDFHPETPWWRGENAVYLGGGKYFGHGLGIRTAELMIEALNETRKPASIRSAYLMNFVARPSFKHLARLSSQPRGYKLQHLIIHHNEPSISCDQYLSYLISMYNNQGI